MSGISGAAANQAKKQTKNAIQVMWKARICGVRMVNRSILVACGPVALTAGEAKSMVAPVEWRGWAAAGDLSG